MLLPLHDVAHHHISPEFALLTAHLTTSSFSLPVVSHMPRLSMSFMSISQLTDFGCQVVFDCTSCRVQDRSRAVIGVGQRHSGVYALESLHLLSFSAPDSYCHALFCLIISGIIVLVTYVRLVCLL